MQLGLPGKGRSRSGAALCAGGSLRSMKSSVHLFLERAASTDSWKQEFPEPKLQWVLMFPCVLLQLWGRKVRGSCRFPRAGSGRGWAVVLELLMSSCGVLCSMMSLW
jgi:hypothetical protein